MTWRHVCSGPLMARPKKIPPAIVAEGEAKLLRDWAGPMQVGDYFDHKTALTPREVWQTLDLLHDGQHWKHFSCVRVPGDMVRVLCNTLFKLDEGH